MARGGRTISEAEYQRVRAEYDRVEPKQFGNLHERMKYLVAAVQSATRAGDHLAVPREVNDAVYDLETEVRYYPPVDPPFGQRVIKRRKS